MRDKTVLITRRETIDYYGDYLESDLRELFDIPEDKPMTQKDWQELFHGDVPEVLWDHTESRGDVQGSDWYVVGVR